jgi:hypothetical protein
MQKKPTDTDAPVLFIKALRLQRTMAKGLEAPGSEYPYGWGYRRTSRGRMS